MPTQSEQRGEWTARTDTPRRSVFGNYHSANPVAAAPASPRANEGTQAGGASVDHAMARAFIYRWLAKAYEDPTVEGWTWLCHEQTRENLQRAIHCLGPLPDPSEVMRLEGFETYHAAYLAAFGHAARGSCPLNEIEYGDIKADPLFQPHRLADLAAFYRAFGLEVAEDAGERQDHICLELEFMCVLAAREAFREKEGGKLKAETKHQEASGSCASPFRDAQKKFLREHLGRWAPAFARRLLGATAEPALKALAEFTRTFVEAECARFEVNPGSEDLLLRPVDEAAESMCAGCGVIAGR